MAEWSLDISVWAEAAKGRLRFVCRRVTLDIFRRVIFMSPVDTGRFRANWQCAIGNMPDGVVDVQFDNAEKHRRGTKVRGHAAGNISMSKATAEVMKFEPGQRIFLVNNLPYAVALEYGHSQQAPGGMVRVTIAEFQALAAAAATAAQSGSTA